jgi:8-amino-7-oxononanoate synthase
MDGDLAPLTELAALAEAHDAWLVIDDAHGFGVLGDNGRGSLATSGVALTPRIILIGTLGKAAGVAGAFAAGDARVIDWLVQRARTQMFTTAAPPALACALSASLQLIAGDEGERRRRHLNALIAHLRTRLAPLPWDLLPSATAIQPLIVGDNQATLDLSAQLLARGLWVPAIRPPTVPVGQARLRITLSAAHTLAEVDQLADALTELAVRTGQP